MVNPLYARLTHNARWPSLRTTLLLTIGLSLVSTLLAAYCLSKTGDLLWAAKAAARQQRFAMGLSSQATSMHTEVIPWSPLPPNIVPLLLLPRLLLVILPIAVILTAIIVTAREVKNKEAYQRLCLALKPVNIVHGLMLTTLHRVRIPLALTLVLLPTLVIPPYQEAQAVAYDGCHTFVPLGEAKDFTDIYGDHCAAPSDTRFLAKAIIEAMAPTTVSWGVSLLGLALAVRLTIRWRLAAFPVLLLCAALSSTAVVLTFLLMHYNFIATCNSSGCGWFVDWPPPTLVCLGLSAPYVLVWVYAMLVRRWA